MCSNQARRNIAGVVNHVNCGGPAAGRSRLGRLRESGHCESDGGERRRDRRPAGFCQEQTFVMTEQFSSMERDAFHVPYLSDKISESVFHGQALKISAIMKSFRNGRDFAAWVGITPRESSTGGRQRLGGSQRWDSATSGGSCTWGRRRSSRVPSGGGRSPIPGLAGCWTKSRGRWLRWLCSRGCAMPRRPNACSVRR